MLKDKIRPDNSLINQIAKEGGNDLKKCYQCGTCSAICPIPTETSPFPRKEMIWAQWGAKERLLSDVDIWLCHQCNDCSEICPRGARPGDVMASLRKIAISAYSFPSFMGRIVQDQDWFLVLLAVPVLIFYVILSYGNPWGFYELRNPTFVEGVGYVFDRFIPHSVIYAIFFPISALAIISLWIGGRRMWRMVTNGKEVKVDMKDILGAFWEILVHKRFGECSKVTNRIAHIGILWGFIFLGITTLASIILMYIFNINPPLPFTGPNMIWKVFGNLGALLLIVGLGIAIARRIREKKDLKSFYSDWSFLAVILIIGVTGWGAQFLRLLEIPKPAYISYFIHLVFVFYLIAYAPYSKFAHFMYRTLAYLVSRRKS